ncbi:hypothetical protein QBC41DRAFT_226831 [Cercophora samala]|uniref:Uncharacterized protein n=1 Tax=Cercophora samala TaxID=330535 RepID=A0AA40D9I3_9PEZI|nr:hypothetical protein QBC41DRAFT_226831 [Cercophora samala]
MCFHKRLLFACSHYAWLMTPESIIPCGVERRFMRGAAIESDNDRCGQMWSHGFYTIKVGDDCRSCVDKKRRRESRIVEVKEVIRSLRVNLERMGSGGGLGHGGVDEECGYDNDEEEGEEEKGREEWGLTVRSKNSDSTRTSGATGLDLTSSPGGWSKTGTGDTSLSLDSEHKRDRGLAKESLMEDENDEDEIENERMEEVSFVFDPQRCTLVFSPAVTTVEV